MWYGSEMKISIFFGARDKIMKKTEILVVMPVPRKRISNQSMFQADDVFPQGICRCGNLWNGVFPLSIDTVSTFLHG